MKRIALTECSAFTIRTLRPGCWRLGIEHRDDAGEPWTGGSGAWLNELTDEQVRQIGNALLDAPAGEAPPDADGRSK